MSQMRDTADLHLKSRKWRSAVCVGRQPAKLIVLDEYFTWRAFFETVLTCAIGVAMMATAISAYFIAPMPRPLRLVMGFAAILMVAPGVNTLKLAAVIAERTLPDARSAMTPERFADARLDQNEIPKVAVNFDGTAGQIRDAADLGCLGPNQLKAFTRCGMGPCQGRFCGLTASEIIAQARNVPVPDVGAMRLRPPVKPLLLGELANLQTELDELRELLPALARHCVGGMIVCTNGHADRCRTVQSFRRKAVSLGVHILENNLAEAIRGKGHIWRVETPGGALEAPNIVNCAGAWGGAIAAMRGDFCPGRSAGSHADDHRAAETVHPPRCRGAGTIAVSQAIRQRNCADRFGNDAYRK